MMTYPSIDMKVAGSNIRAFRKERGITIREVAEYMGFREPTAVYKWQRGECLPTVDNLFALSKLLGTSMEAILIGEER